MAFVCEFCGGDTKWTFGPSDSTWWHCERGCHKFVMATAQLELFECDRVCSSLRSGDAAATTRVVGKENELGELPF